MQSLSLLKCLGKALLRSGGNVADCSDDEIAKAAVEAWHAWKRAKNEKQRRDELQALAEMPIPDFRRLVKQLLQSLAAEEPEEKKERISSCLHEVQLVVRESYLQSDGKKHEGAPRDLLLRGPEDLISLLSAARPQPAGVVLTQLDDDAEGRRYMFEERATCVMGRDKDCHPRFPKDKKHLRISRHHCLLEINLPDVFIRDLGSRTGTYLNGKLIGKRPKQMTAEEGQCLAFKDHQLAHGDEIKLTKKGAAVFRVDIFQPAQCMECGAVIVDEDRSKCERKTGIYECAKCRKKSVAEAKREMLRRCAQCGRDVGSEDGANRPGQFICGECRTDPEKILRKYQSGEQGSAPGLPFIRGFSVRKKLGQGGMGVVWLARHDKSGRDVAVKIMLPKVAANELAVRKALKEMANTRLLKHRNVARLVDTGYSGGVFFMVLEYCDGGSVAQLMQKRGGMLPVDEAVEITLQALEGLHYAHNVFGPAKGIVHRDLKPANIFLSGHGSGRVARIGDYGLAKALDESGLSGSTRTRTTGGTPLFMPRVQVIDYKGSGPAVDVWAIAATLYNMLTGAFPRDFKEGEDPWLNILEAVPVPIRKRKPDLPSKLAKVVDLALTEEPEIHFQTAREFKKALEAAY